MNQYVKFEDAIHLVSPSGESLCILGPEYIAEHPEITGIPRLDYEKQRKYSEIAEARWQAEVGGVTLNGMAIDTSRESQALVTGAALQATLDPDYTYRWKTAVGFVTLDAQTVLTVARAVRTHVQACFDHEAELEAQIEAAETPEEVQAIEYETL